MNDSERIEAAVKGTATGTPDHISPALSLEEQCELLRNRVAESDAEIKRLKAMLNGETDGAIKELRQALIETQMECEELQAALGAQAAQLFRIGARDNVRRRLAEAGKSAPPSS